MIKAKRGDSESGKVGKVVAIRTVRLPRSGFVHLTNIASIEKFYLINRYRIMAVVKQFSHI